MYANKKLLFLLLLLLLLFVVVMLVLINKMSKLYCNQIPKNQNSNLKNGWVGGETKLTSLV
jgi:hypothetical protein